MGRRKPRGGPRESAPAGLSREERRAAAESARQAGLEAQRLAQVEEEELLAQRRVLLPQDLLEEHRSVKRTQAHSRGALPLPVAESWRLPSKNPLVLSDNGALEVRRELDVSWALDAGPNAGLWFPPFLDRSRLDPSATAEIEVAREGAAALAADLRVLARSPAHRFWSTVRFSTQFKVALHSVFKQLPRPWEGQRLMACGDPEFVVLCDTLRRRLWRLLMRFALNRDGDYTIPADLVAETCLGMSDDGSVGAVPVALLPEVVSIFGFSVNHRAELRRVLVRFAECAQVVTPGSFFRAVAREPCSTMIGAFNGLCNAADETVTACVSSACCFVDVFPESSHMLLEEGGISFLGDVLSLCQHKNKIVASRSSKLLALIIRHGILRVLLIAGGAAADPGLCWCERCRLTDREDAIPVALIAWLADNASNRELSLCIDEALQRGNSDISGMSSLLTSTVRRTVKLSEQQFAAFASALHFEGDGAHPVAHVQDVPPELENLVAQVREVSGDPAVGAGAVVLVWLEFQQSDQSASSSAQEYVLGRVLDQLGSTSPLSVQLRFAAGVPATTIDVASTLGLAEACTLLSGRINGGARSPTIDSDRFQVPDGEVIWHEKGIYKDSGFKDELERDDELIQSILRLSQSELTASLASEDGGDGYDEERMYDDEYNDTMDAFGGKNLDMMSSTGDSVLGDIGNDVIYVDDVQQGPPNGQRNKSKRTVGLSNAAPEFVPLAAKAAPKATSFGRGARLASGDGAAKGLSQQKGGNHEASRGGSSSRGGASGRGGGQKGGGKRGKRGGGGRGRGTQKNAAARKQGLG